MVEFKQTLVILCDAVGNCQRKTFNGFWKRETILREINKMTFGRFAEVQHITLLPDAKRRTQIVETAYTFTANPVPTGGYKYA